MDNNDLNKNQSGLEFTEATESRDFLKQTLNEKQALLAQVNPKSSPIERANLQLEIAEIMLDVSESGMPEAAWGLAKEAFKLFMDHDDIE